MIGLGWQRADLLEGTLDTVGGDTLTRRRAAVLAALKRDHWRRASDALERVVQAVQSPLSVDFGSAVITLGEPGEICETGMEAVRDAIDALIPWRKGPYSIAGEYIDAEWRSDKKWERIETSLPPLAGTRVLDIGCNSGYYMFRLLGHALRAQGCPEAIIGIDPSESFYYAFELLQALARRPELQYEPLGVEEIELFGESFDLVLCLGIIYHQRDPLNMLRAVKGVMRKDAVLILESQAIPGEDPVALSPFDRYAKARNVYFVPTASCMCAWLTRAGFRDVEVISSSEVTTDEQRRTALAPYESLADFLDPSDLSKTIEGYPAPLRVAVRAVK